MIRLQKTTITANMSANTITDNTIIGFKAPGGLKYITAAYDVADLTTGAIVSNGGRAKGMAQDEYATEVADHTRAVYGRDIAAGIGMTVANRTAKPSQNIGIAITTMRTGAANGWSIVETLSQSDAVRLMHKWYMEHGLMDLYMRNKYTAISGFQEWLCGKLIKFFTPNNKFQWYGHAMDLDYEMEATGCDFTACLCDTNVPSENRRHVIPNQLYDRFGLFGHATRMALWVEGKPETEEEADMILHRARLAEDLKSMNKLMRPILRKEREREHARRAGIELDKKVVQDLLTEAKAFEEAEAPEKAKAELVEVMCSVFKEKQSCDLATGGGETGGRRGGGITWAGPVKYIDPFRGAEEGARLAAHESKCNKE